MTEQYRKFVRIASRFIPRDRIYTDALRRLAWGTDAGFYRLIPQVVVRSVDEREVARLLRLAGSLHLPVTFRAAGTSLSGQTVSDSILIVAGKHWERYEVLDGGEAVRLEPGIVGARVNAILRRTRGTTGGDVIEAGGIRMDKAAHIVEIDGKQIELSYKEFELLSYFMENAGIALSREKILNNVWNYDYFGDARTIDTHVKKLRSKLGDKGEYIRTIWGMGYKFEVG